ncbi:hypothetical protein [Flavobacterium sp.]|uniref:hypothetical protein n=1 Tax=Flavobacterium sp. TaxID=239 RepID=UPI0038FC39F0
MATRTEILALINGITTGSPNTALEIRTLLTEMVNYPVQIGTIRQKDVTNAYIVANFDGTGLGINEEEGWALRNSQNGTRNSQGRVNINYDPTNYPTMGATGGSKDAVVVAHSHTTAIKRHTNGAGVIGLFDQANGGADEVYTSSTTGVSGTDKNMQPYIVVLETVFIGYD